MLENSGAAVAEHAEAMRLVDHEPGGMSALDLDEPGQIRKIAVHAVQWTAPKFESVDPVKDAAAELKMIRTGTLDLFEAISRNGYDPEERFAVVYLRIKGGLSQWKEVKSAFDVLFPPGQLRRTSAPAVPNNKALPPTYPERSVGGLECRYYRIRESEGC